MHQGMLEPELRAHCAYRSTWDLTHLVKYYRPNVTNYEVGKYDIGRETNETMITYYMPNHHLHGLVT